jgi:putative tricarboxylic transport membrane protein
VLYPAILVLAVVGAYSVRGSMFDIYMLIIFSVLGYAFRKLAIPPTPLLMAFVLGPQAENAIRQSLTLSDNNLLIFVERPISAIVLGLAVVVVVLAIYTGRRPGGRLPTKDSITASQDDSEPATAEPDVDVNSEPFAPKTGVPER